MVTHDMGVHANVANRIGIMYAGKIVEEGTTLQIFETPEHPYTRFLINSLPKFGDKNVCVQRAGQPAFLGGCAARAARSIRAAHMSKIFAASRCRTSPHLDA